MNLLKRSFPAVLALAALGMMVGSAFAGGPIQHFQERAKCHHCGGDDHCRKICKVVDDVKEVPVICWSDKCEDFCVPGPCVKGCKHCEPKCKDGGKGCACSKGECPSHEKRFCYRDNPITCGKVYTRKMLMQKTIIKKVPSQKLIVEYVCGKCDAKGKASDAEVPKPPVDTAFRHPRGGYVAQPTIILYAPHLAPGVPHTPGQPIQIPAVQVQPSPAGQAVQIPAIQVQPGQVQAVQIPPAHFPPVHAHPAAYAPQR